MVPGYSYFVFRTRVSVLTSSTVMYRYPIVFWAQVSDVVQVKIDNMLATALQAAVMTDNRCRDGAVCFHVGAEYHVLKDEESFAVGLTRPQ